MHLLSRYKDLGRAGYIWYSLDVIITSEDWDYGGGVDRGLEGYAFLSNWACNRKRRRDYNNSLLRISGSEFNMVSAGRGVVYIYLVLTLASHSANPLFSVSVHIANHP